MSSEELTVTFSAERLKRLNGAKALFESDTKQGIELDVFVDTLVETYLSYRSLRGANESSLLKKITDKP